MCHRLPLALLLLSALVLQVHAACQLTREMIEGTNRIFATRLGTGAYRLKRATTVATNEVLHMICQPNDIIQTRCQPNRRFTRTLPMRCNNPMSPDVVVVQDLSCARLRQHEMYSIGYTVGGSRLEIFRSCYDRTNVRAAFTQHMLFARAMETRSTCSRLERDGLISDSEASTYEPHSIFRAFRRHFGNNHNYLPNNHTVVILPGQLTPRADYTFVDQICATLRYINVMAQFKSIHQGNVEKIERWVRAHISGVFMRIQTGRIGILQLADSRGAPKPVLLGAGSENSMPHWIYKLVRERNNRPLYAFLILNNIYAAQRPAAPSRCQVVPCPRGLVLENSARAGYAFCCNPNMWVFE